MPQWMDELDELIKGMGKPAPAQDDDEDDGYDGEDDEDGDDEGSEPAPPMKKSASREGCYPPADNGDDDDENGEQPNGAKVRDPEKIERYTKGGKIKQKTANAGSESGKVAKSVRDLVDDEAAEVIDGANALGQIANAIDTLVGRFSKSLRRFEARIAQVEEGQALIGQAVTKSLQSVQGEVEQIARQPRGRKAVTKAVDRKFAGSDAPTQPDRATILEKSMKALAERRISAVESASVDSFMNRGLPLPPALLAKINGAG
jgi:hypothetical protein